MADGFFGMYRCKPVPPTPTHCRTCGVELEALRRYAGLCGPCVRARPRAPVPAEPADPPLRIVRRFQRSGEAFVEYECGCGARRTMRRRLYEADPPRRCKHCQRRAGARRRRFWG